MPTPAQTPTERTTALIGFLVGAAIWLAIAVATYCNWIRLDLVELLFLLAPWVIVPTALSLTPALAKSYPAGIFRSHHSLIFTAAALCTYSFLRPAGTFSPGTPISRLALSTSLSAFLASSWLLVCLCIAWGGINRLLTLRVNSYSQFCFAVAECYIAVGGVWLVMSRAGLHPSGFQEPIVLLTAVHFHFAGFLSSIFAGLTYSQLQATKWAKPLRIILLATLLGPGFLGIAFLISPKLKLIAVTLIVIGQCGLAAGMARISATIARGMSALFLALAAVCVAAGMIYAATWALGEYPLQPMTDLSHMERIHGVLNGIGFGVIGLLGWINLCARDERDVEAAK